jgi:hypothetical protein
MGINAVIVKVVDEQYLTVAIAFDFVWNIY